MKHGIIYYFLVVVILCFPVVEDSDNNQYEFQKRKCHSYFKEMYFAFLEFRKSLEGKLMRTLHWIFF